jgi:restriction endonuclease S subunit
MRESWIETTLGAAAEVAIGRQRSPRNASGEHMVKYLRAANVQDGRLALEDVLSMSFSVTEQAKFGLEPGDVLVTEGCGSIRELGASAVWNGDLTGPVCFQNTLIRIRSRVGLTLPTYLEHWARNAHATGRFAAVSSGTNIFHIGLRRAQNMRFSLPPLNEQRRIVDVISAVDRTANAAHGVVTAARMSLFSIRRAIFSSTSDRKQLRDALTLQRGFDLPSSERTDGDVPVVASNGQVDTHGVAKVSAPGVVTGRSGTIGRVWLLERDFWPLNTTLYVKDFKGNDPRFVRHLLADMELGRFAGGSTVPSLNRNVLDLESVHVPSVTEQTTLADLLDSLDSNVERAGHLAGEIAAVRASVMASLLSGEHEIPESYDELLTA